MTVQMQNTLHLFQTRLEGQVKSTESLNVYVCAHSQISLLWDVVLGCGYQNIWDKERQKNGAPPLYHVPLPSTSTQSLDHFF